MAAMLRRAADVLDPNAQEQQPPKRRQRITQDNGAADVASTASLDCVNDDCLVFILSFLPIDDLNSNIAVCNKRF
jgi:hypothetical protein